MSNINTALLAAIVAATQSTDQYGMFAENEDLTNLVNAGLVGTNSGMRDTAAGTIAAQATEKGIAYQPENGSTAGETAAPKVVKARETFGVTTFARPATAPRTRNSPGSKYPFDDLAAPDENGDVSGFFVPATDDMPDPVKSLSSAVSQANRKYGEETGVDGRGHKTYRKTRVFRAVASTDPNSPGAFVFRDADNNGDEDEGNEGDES